MEIVKIEPTPSPNTMKIILSQKREDNKSNTYTEIKKEQPAFINQLLEIPDVKSIFHVLDFISVDKVSKADWENVLPKITESLSNESITPQQVEEPDIHFGEVTVEILKFKNIPYQIKLTSGNEELRHQLSDDFIQAMTSAQKPNDNVVFMRNWESLGVRFGDMDEIMTHVEAEINALYPLDILRSLVQKAQESNITVPQKAYKRVTLDTYRHTQDWKERLRMLKAFPKPTVKDYSLLNVALHEEKVPLRREAVVLLSMIEDKATLPYLYKGLNDTNPAVRRTAGDALSDLGYKEALPEMEKALSDPQKIVRWRAAMFLFDEGGYDQLKALKAHQNDEAYEVKLQIEMAITRIENGEAALGSVWKQIANRNK
ncbi:virulence factor [Staphylococcus hyicus]|uniref:virulence factor n=1 Tax=Staphylococcus hyicus TaxID=1284 RepID=UPI0027388619|nr:virulence factor [Staphylococcus hyicus]MDP4468259.1 virulence factor [Staphylococcus hyicus]